MLIISYVSNAGPTCGSRFVRPSLLPPVQGLAGRYYSPTLGPCFTLVTRGSSIFTIDIKKPRKPYPIEDAIKRSHSQSSSIIAAKRLLIGSYT
jgi:hypothetical protein